MTTVRNNRTLNERAHAHGVLRFMDTRVLNIIVLASTATLFVGYLAVITQSATKGFTIKNLEHSISALEDEGKRLDVDAVTHQTMGSIEERVQELGLVPVPSVDYMSGSASAVAVR